LAITRARKEELVAIYGDILNHTSGFVITEFRGLPMGKVNELRAKLREVNGAYIVTKNTLFKIALNNAGWPVPENLLVGPVATGFADGNVSALAKAMLAFAKDNPENFVIKGGIMGGSVLTAAQVQAISELPPLEDLRAQLAGLIVQPASGLLGVLNAATGSIVNVLDAFVQKNQTPDAAA
jgi:large subunit ribosomal protein L10